MVFPAAIFCLKRFCGHCFSHLFVRSVPLEELTDPACSDPIQCSSRGETEAQQVFFFTRYNADSCSSKYFFSFYRAIPRAHWNKGTETALHSFLQHRNSMTDTV